MLRAVIFGLLAVSAVASCKSGSDSGQVAAGAVAGRVVEASGKVAATRDGKTRSLAVGNDVFRDDVIETGADGSLVIELAHNNARWAVEGNQRARVDESVAWGLAKQDKPAKVIDHATSAAGRDGERTAADTRATTEAAPAAPAAAQKPDPSLEQRKVETKEAAKDEYDGGKADVRNRGVDPGAVTKDTPPPPPPPAPKLEPKRAPPPVGAAGLEDTGGGGSMTGAGSAGPTRGGRVKSPQSIVDSKRAELVACANGAAITLVVKLTNGKPKVMLQGSGTTAIRACVDAIIAGLEFPAIDGSATLKLGEK